MVDCQDKNEGGVDYNVATNIVRRSMFWPPPKSKKRPRYKAFPVKDDDGKIVFVFSECVRTQKQDKQMWNAIMNEVHSQFGEYRQVKLYEQRAAMGLTNKWSIEDLS